jgi:hypothetical protein
MVENESLVRLAIDRVVFQRVKVKDNDVTLFHQRHVGREKTRFDGTLPLD